MLHGSHAHRGVLESCLLFFSESIQRQIARIAQKWEGAGHIRLCVWRPWFTRKKQRPETTPFEAVTGRGFAVLAAVTAS